MNAHYNTDNFPIFVCNHGNWDIYRNVAGYCAAIPTAKALADGCKATHFGDLAYTLITLGAEVTGLTWEECRRAA